MIVDRSLSCLILAGGLGSRLASVLADIPKPMAIVAGRPFLEFLVEQARAWKCEKVVLCVGHRAEVIEKHFGDGRDFGITIVYSRERELLGTGGAVALAAERTISDPFLVLNGDSFCPADLDQLRQTHQRARATATIVVAPVNDAARFGAVEFDPSGAVTAFREKGRSAGIVHVNAGVYLLTRAALRSIKPGERRSLETQVFPALIGAGLYAMVQPSPFIDIGTPDSLKDSQTILPQLYDCKRS